MNFYGCPGLKTHNEGQLIAYFPAGNSLIIEEYNKTNKYRNYKEGHQSLR